MEHNIIYHGDAVQTMKTFPDKSINSIITSPPYWKLRDYKWNGQWGQEPTFHMYLENLWRLMDESWRVLVDNGTAWINLGDTYNSSGSNQNGRGEFGSGINGVKYYSNAGGGSARSKPTKEVPEKCLLLLPHRFAIGCIDRGWIMRNDILWGKRNAMPESVTDRFSKKHEYFFFMVKNQDYYFDIDSIRDKLKNAAPIRNKASEIYGRGSNSRQFSEGERVWGSESLGRNPGNVSDFWDIPTQPSKKNHFATYNNKLIDKPIIAGCPPGGIILDPLCGTATTGCRSIELGRKFIGIEGSEVHFNDATKAIQPYKEMQQLFT